jgi:hypothetical protein
MKNIDQNQKINDDIINKSEINQNQEDQIQNDKSSNCLNKVNDTIVDQVCVNSKIVEEKTTLDNSSRNLISTVKEENNDKEIDNHDEKLEQLKQETKDKLLKMNESYKAKRDEYDYDLKNLKDQADMCKMPETKLDKNKKFNDQEQT